MRLEEYVKQAKRTESIRQPLDREVSMTTGLTDRIAHGLLGAQDERLELLQALRSNSMINVKEELGDILWFTAILIDAVDREMTSYLRSFLRPELGIGNIESNIKNLLKREFGEENKIPSVYYVILNSLAATEKRTIASLLDALITSQPTPGIFSKRTDNVISTLIDNTPVNVVKGAMFYGKTIDWIKILRVIVENVDVTYSILLDLDMDLSIYDIMDMNIKKLKARYPDKYKDEDAINRNIENEYKAMEE